MDDDWISTTGTVTENDHIDLAWMQQLFPNKTVSKLECWLKTLRDNEFESVSDLKNLDEEEWGSLSLPLAIKSGLKQAVKRAAATADTFDVDTFVSPSDIAVTVPDVSQIDCIVIDISASMRARSSIDVDKTREDVSKMLFHTMVDKLITLELYHGVGLLAFGEYVVPIGITREYERFHDELGRLDANQGRTKLYDAIKNAAEMIEEYASVHINTPPSGKSNEPLTKIVKRVFVLTDGEDNASTQLPWEVAQFLQQKGIVVDAIPLAGANRTLQSICTASGGMCFEVVSQEQGMALFEREATLHVSYREAVDAAPAVTDSSSLKALEKTAESPVVDIRSAPSRTLLAPVMSAQAAMQTATTATTGAARTGGGATRCIMRQYVDFMSNPVEGCTVYVNEENCFGWKAVMTGLPYPYDGGIWVLTIDFPQDYPFKPPRIKFSTPVYHCNINNDGNICLDLLKDRWSPAITISAAMRSIKELLFECNPDDPLDTFKAQLYRDNKGAYQRAAKEHTERFALSTFDDLAQYGLSLP
jgi:ubiquitin-protein ligase/Mg-chelatase subunit ChlD